MRFAVPLKVGPALLLVTLAACSEQGLHTLGHPPDSPVPAIEVSPPKLDFWTVSNGDTETLPFTIKNVGGAILDVTDIQIGGDQSGSFALATPFDELLVDPGASAQVDVTFTPLDPDENAAQATVASNDPENPEVSVDLSGSGKVPRLEITPATWDFGTHAVPCGDSVELTLENVGSDVLTVTSLDFLTDGQMSIRDLPAVPFTLGPKVYVNGYVDYTPSAEGATTSTLTATSTDPHGTTSATQTGTGSGGSSASDHFAVPTDPPVDILFAVDQSCSMDDDAANLAANFSTFISDVNAVTTGWHIGVVTYDSGCFNHGVLTSSTADVEALFEDAVTLGTDAEIANDEALLQLSDRALKQTGSTACNAGFLRPGALLHVIVVTDEPERSTETAAAWTWDYWVKDYYNYVSSDPLLKVSGVVDSTGCNEGDLGYDEAISATGGELLSICSTDWADKVTKLAEASTTLAWSFPLSQPAVPASIAVTIDGVPTSAWSYDSDLNAVLFSSAPSGAAIDVTYDVASSCN